MRRDERETDSDRIGPERELGCKERYKTMSVEKQL